MRSWQRTFNLACFLGTMVLGEVAWGQQGYSIQNSAVVVESSEHWKHWQATAKTIQITEEGVKPDFIRKSTTLEIEGTERVVPGINAVLNAAEFGGGIWDAGSNRSSAEHLMDGRMDTYWTPDPSVPLRDWWVQVDLGRAVSAHKIVLKFVGEDLGDPFLQFKVLTSQGETIIGPLVYRKRFSTDKPIKDERVFEIDLTSQLPTKWPQVRGDFTGDVIRFISVVVTDSDFGQARQVSQSTYEELNPDQQGDIEYFRRETSGRLRLLEGREDWDALATDSQGPVVHYRRELPRLAEVEVWSIGDNIGIGVLERGGKVTSWENNGAEGVVVDGVIYSVEKALYWPAQGGYNPDRLLPSQPPDVERALVVDLGGSFFLDNIRVLQASSSPPGPFRAYRIEVSDGSTNAGGSLAWKTVGAIDNINRSESYHDFKFPLTKVEHFSFTYKLHVGAGRHGLSEIQFFGEGYMPESRIESVFDGPSAFIELAATPQNLASIEWDADMPPGTDIILQTRTGDTVTTNTLYYKKNGELYPGSEEEAAEAHATDKKFFGDASVGPVVTQTNPGRDWSSWSQRYFNSGDKITSPSPRKFVAIRATFLTENPLVAATLRWVKLNFVTPVAKTVVGEVLPPQLETIGAEQLFSYFVRTTFEPANEGFDEILIAAPSSVKMKFKQAQLSLPGQPTQTYTAQSEGFAVVSDDSDSLWVRLPAPIKTTGAAALVELEFAATIFDFTTFFNGSIGHSSIPSSWQRVDPGDANEIADSEKTVILALERGAVLGDIEVKNSIFTPNGDGINDRLTVSFSLMRVKASTPLQVKIYDLGGRLVHQLRDEYITTGRHSVVWSGVDESGALVPPGIYVLRTDIAVDAKSSRKTSDYRLLHVSY